ncbi:MAG TPA: hydrogenase maturation nickel metallochaperone HypA [Anaerolineales bacterium]|nr:hydrogenase maturation nickel metallochaperone HypA [Anaerolineales bacterium]
MREFEATKTIFHQALQLAKESDSSHFRGVYLALGEMAELDRDKIQTHWIELSKGTPLEHAQLHFRLITAETQCMACFKKYHPENGKIHCPHCGSFGAKILSGEEFHFESIETDIE